MQRRSLIAAAASGWLVPALAHHGWSSFDTDRPLYLEGRATAVRWRNPHAEVTLEVPPDLRLPGNLATRAVPAQTAAVDGPALLAKAALPRRREARWTLELAPLTRLSAWQVKEIAPGTPLSVVGFMPPDEQGEAVMRVEYLFVHGQAYGLRSSPA